MINMNKLCRKRIRKNGKKLIEKHGNYRYIYQRGRGYMISKYEENVGNNGTEERK